MWNLFLIFIYHAFITCYERIDEIELYFLFSQIYFHRFVFLKMKKVQIYFVCVLNIDSWNVNDFFMRAIWNRKKGNRKEKRTVPSLILFYFPFLHTVKYVKKSMPLAVNRYYFFELYKKKKCKVQICWRYYVMSDS